MQQRDLLRLSRRLALVEQELRQLRAHELGSAYTISLDFTGTDWDTKAKCAEVGLRFSDDASPFPGTLVEAIAGSWSHSAGNGWQPASGSNGEGPGIVFPLVRGGNFQLEMTIDLTGASAAQESRIGIGYIDTDNHVGSYARTVDNDGSNIEYQALLATNNGNDTFNDQYTGTSTTGAAVYTLKYRSKNGCCSVWDDQDDAWHDFEGRDNTASSFTASFGFIQAIKRTGATLNTLYIASLEISYLL